MNTRKYNKIFFIIILSVLTFVILLNVTVDPYNIFNFPTIKHFNYYKPEAKRQERLTKFLNLKTLKDIDTVFIGVSRTDWTLAPDYYKKITGNNASNMAMAAADFVEYRTIINNSIKIKPSISKIVLAVDLEKYMPTATKTDNIIIVNSESKNITSSELSSVLFSIDTTVSSFITIIKNISGNTCRSYLPNGMKNQCINNDIVSDFSGSIKLYKNSGNCFHTVPINLNLLEQFINELKQQNIEVILYIPPMPISYMEILDYNNAWDGVDKFKETLANIQPFYDFLYVNDVNTEKISPDMKYYFEVSHATHFAGEKVLDKIFTNKGDFGVLVTPDNVKSHNLQNRKDLKEWQKNNQDTRNWVHKVMQSKEDE